METENKPTSKAGKHSAQAELRDEYVKRSEAIVQHARDNGRELTFTEVKILNELSRAIVNLHKTIKPGDEKRGRLIVIEPREFSEEEIKEMRKRQEQG